MKSNTQGNAMKTKTQNAAIISYMKKHKGITTLQAADIGVLSLSRRICELTEKGYVISKTWITLKDTRWGATKIIKYRLVK